MATPGESRRRESSTAEELFSIINSALDTGSTAYEEEQKHECPLGSPKHVQAEATRTGPKHTQDYGTKEDIASISDGC
ncbi:hypothetical protein AMELA_G00254950 [Ameiurus melas]|uniref:Uncharacterized protein n=1 Tax=Ameiurus melas TaxID=219545 RepID=A0A7J5ZR18_AMEME|nr:hypothetical protein AMELA_G00254950 [Ameiurus melas]